MHNPCKEYKNYVYVTHVNKDTDSTMHPVSQDSLC